MKHKPRRTASTASKVETPSRSLRPDVLAVIILIASVFLVFGRTLTYGLVNWDDHLNVTGNPAVAEPSWTGLLSIWKAPFADLYVPLFYSTLMLDSVLSGGLVQFTATDALPLFHFSNLCFHCIGILALYALLRRHLKFGIFLSVVGALLFAIHPLQAEAVSWITGRKDLLAAAFLIPALLAFAEWMEGRRTIFYAAATGLFVCALLSKPVAVVFPVMAFAFALWKGAPFRFAVFAAAPWLVLSVCWLAITNSAQSVDDAAATMLPIWKRPLVATDSLLHYLVKIVWPVNLMPIYPRSNLTVFQGYWIWIAPVVIGLAGLAAWKQRGSVALGAAWMLLLLLPVLGLTPFYYQHHSNVADRYAYLPMAGAAVVFCSLLQWMLLRWSARRRLLQYVTAVGLTLLGAVCFIQAGHWKSSETLWKREISLYPSNAMGQCLLGAAYIETRKYEEAEKQFRRTLEVDPAFPEAYNWLGQLFEQHGRQPEAKELAQLAVSRLGEQTFLEATTRGQAFITLQKWQDAARAFGLAATYEPSDASVHARAGLALYRLGDLINAEAALTRSLQLDPRSATTHDWLAVVLHKQGKKQEAVQLMTRAVELEPGNSEYQEKLEKLR